MPRPSIQRDNTRSYSGGRKQQLLMSSCCRSFAARRLALKLLSRHAAAHRGSMTS